MAEEINHGGKYLQQRRDQQRGEHPRSKNMRKSSLFCPLSSLWVAPTRGVGPACSLILSIYEGWTWQSTTGASLPSSTSTRQTTRMSSEVTKRFSSGEDLFLDSVDSRNPQVAYRNICEFHICAWRYIQTNKSDAVAFHFLAFYSFIISKEFDARLLVNWNASSDQLF